MKIVVALCSYWLLFIIAPVSLIIWLVRSIEFGFILGIAAFFILLVMGEHGFRIWKKWWRIK